MRCLIRTKGIVPPEMFIGEATTLGVISEDNDTSKISLSLVGQPYQTHIHFYNQNLVAVISTSHHTDISTFNIPFCPKLNEFYSRHIAFRHDQFRCDQIGLAFIISVNDTDLDIRSLSVNSIIIKIFEEIYYEAKYSYPGLATQQLIKKMGGLQGLRVFKISGVRNLIKMYGLNRSFTKKTAFHTLTKPDSDSRLLRFTDHERLFIQQRPTDIKLSVNEVFEYLVDKGLFRIGSEVICSMCHLKSWVPLDDLKHEITCDHCGNIYDITRQLTAKGEWEYRRSGVLGAEKNAFGAVPVLLTLQQLDVALHTTEQSIYSTSVEIKPTSGIDGVCCEIDFIWMIPRVFPSRSLIILGECKDQGPVTEKEVLGLLEIAKRLQTINFDIFILLSQISEFTPTEIALATSINSTGYAKVILLSARELEHYQIYEQTKDVLGQDHFAHNPEKMADNTIKLYLS